MPTEAELRAKPCVSVIVCTHNPRLDYLQRVMDCLRGQTLSRAQWEFLLVDNASAEPLAETLDLTWHPHARHVREDTLGLTHARLRGIAESSGEILVFIDDDNLPAHDYLEVAVAIHARNPHLGAFGAGRLEPEFESPSPRELSPYLHLLALRSVQGSRYSNNAKDHSCIPWGAGLCVTRDVADAYGPLIESLDVTRIIGRRGEELFCGEDDLFSVTAVTLGKGFGIHAELVVEHLIPATRLTRDYIVRLIRGHAFSHGVLDYVLFGVRPGGIRFHRYARLALHGIRNGGFSLRCRWAAAHGQELAARFIAEHELQCRSDVVASALQAHRTPTGSAVDANRQGIETSAVAIRHFDNPPFDQSPPARPVRIAALRGIAR
jgi:glycosyltransferase involved in cell wall biosynthesis